MSTPSHSTPGTPGEVAGTLEGGREQAVRPVRAPLALALLGAAVIAILGLIYVHEVIGLTAANDDLHTLQAEQRGLERQDSQLHAQLGEVTSPDYVDKRARALGLVPSDPSTPVIVVVVAGPSAGGQR